MRFNGDDHIACKALALPFVQSRHRSTISSINRKTERMIDNRKITSLKLINYCINIFESSDFVLTPNNESRRHNLNDSGYKIYKMYL